MQVDLIDFYAEDGVLLNGFISKANSKKNTYSNSWNE